MANKQSQTDLRKSFYLGQVKYRLEAELVRQASNGEDLDSLIIPIDTLWKSEKRPRGHIPQNKLIESIRLPGVLEISDLNNWDYLFSTPSWHDDFHIPMTYRETCLSVEECNEAIELSKRYIEVKDDRYVHGFYFGTAKDFTRLALENPEMFYRFQTLRLKNGRLNWDNVAEVEKKQQDIFNGVDNPQNPYSDWNSSPHAYRQALAKFYADEIKRF